MKKYFNYILFFAFTFFIFISNTYAREIKVYFFHGDGCPHCAEEEKALTKIKKKYKPKNNKLEYFSDDN